MAQVECGLSGHGGVDEVVSERFRHDLVGDTRRCRVQDHTQSFRHFAQRRVVMGHAWSKRIRRLHALFEHLPRCPVRTLHIGMALVERVAPVEAHHGRRVRLLVPNTAPLVLCMARPHR